MKDIKIIHTADLHLDAPCARGENITEAKRRQEELREVFSEIIRIASKENADLLLFAGDIFDSQNADDRTRQWVLEEISSLPATRVFFVCGNHDYYTEKSIFSEINELPNAHVFCENQIQAVHIDELGLSIYGASFTSPFIKDSQFAETVELDKNRINILLMHGDLKQNGQSSEYNPIFHSQIEKSGFDYVALGHVHKYDGIKRVGAVCYAYPGCPQGRGFDELDEKRILVGTVNKAKVKLSFVNTSITMYRIININISEADKSSKIKEIIRENVNDENAKKNFYRIILTGKVSEDLFIHPTGLKKDLADDFFYVEIIDNTEVNIDLYKLSNEKSLKGLFIKNILNRIENTSDELELHKLNLAIRYALSAFAGKDVELV